MAGDEASSAPGLRLAELLAAVSLATDLAHDVPAESALRDAVLAVEFARLLGWDRADVSNVYYLRSSTTSVARAPSTRRAGSASVTT